MRQDDPLAFGVERLRAARATYVDELDRVRRSLPPTAPPPWSEPAASPVPPGGRSPRLGPKLLPLAPRSRRPANGIGAGGIVWHLIGRASRAEHADHELSSALDRDRKAKEEAANVGEADRAHREALRDNGAALDSLEESVADFGAALDRTRGERVLAMLGDGAAPPHLTAVLGAVPEGLTRRQLWCGLAFEVEAYRDVHPEPGRADSAGLEAALGPRPERFEEAPAWDYLASRISLGPAIIAAAADLDAAFDAGAPDQWVQRLDRAVADHQAEATLDAGTNGPPSLIAAKRPPAARQIGRSSWSL